MSAIPTRADLCRRYRHVHFGSKNSYCLLRSISKYAGVVRGVNALLEYIEHLVGGIQKSWRRLDGHNQLPKLVRGVKFDDGIKIIVNSAAPQTQNAA